MNPLLRTPTVRFVARFLVVGLVLLAATSFFAHTALAQDPPLSQIDIPGPAGSESFGQSVATLPNGNFVVTDPLYDDGATVDVGAVFLYDGNTLQIISMLKGSSLSDQVGSDGITVLANGNFVVTSLSWNGGMGAVTWGNAASGWGAAEVTLSAANCLVGSQANDAVGSGGITPLPNGNYVVGSYNWNNNAGAATLAQATGTTVGAVSSSNSLVGSITGDQVGGLDSVTVLTNGNYVVASPHWSSDFGAVTLGSGTTGVSGAVTVLNSLVGSSVGDSVGVVTALANGNYVVSSSQWDSEFAVDVGAVTWGDGVDGIADTIDNTNSLVGTTAGDGVGEGVTALTNGNYVVRSHLWDNGGAVDAGAVTWGSGATGVVGDVSPSNSLVGTSTNDWVGLMETVALPNGNFVAVSDNWGGQLGAVTWGNGSTGLVSAVSASNSLIGAAAGDFVGTSGVTVLTNGNYVVGSRLWNSSMGAATWGSGTAGVTGVVSDTNSLVGTTFGDQVGQEIKALTNNNYLALSPGWNNTPFGLSNAGAVTWGNGTLGSTGVVSTTNSLVGASSDDNVGTGAAALPGGKYVVTSPLWDAGVMTDTGAATWISSGAGPVTGSPSPANSLVGGVAGDQVGSDGVTVLVNGNYVVHSALWAGSLGAVTWGNSALGSTGVVSATNSLVGATVNDNVGSDLLTALSNGNFAFASPLFDGSGVDSGAMSLGNGKSGTAGALASNNSVLGSSAGGGSTLNYKFSAVHQYIVVGRPADDMVTVTALQHLLTVTPAGNGVGTVTSLPAGIDCGLTCTTNIDGNFVVTLTATPATSSLFTGWAGDCTGAGSCNVTMDQARNVTATFTLKTFPLTVTQAGTGAGTVNGIPANPAAINYGTVVTLTAAPAISSTFTMWSGDCTGGGDCVLTIDQARTVTATFTLKTFALSVAKAGTGGGNVNGIPANPAAINYGTVVTLTAAPEISSTFGAWSGDCSGPGACVLTVDGAKSVTATFAIKTFALTVIKAGTGNGSVSGIPANPAALVYGTVVTLTASPLVTSTFAGWSGACLGTGACVITMDAAKSVTATFPIKTFALTVTPAGTGSGTVSGIPPNPAAINIGTVITLTATPSTTSTFAGWSGACLGAGACVITMDAAKSVTATFPLKQFDVNVTPNGTGGTVQVTVLTQTVESSGAAAVVVSVSPASVDTPATLYPLGTVLELTAIPDPGFAFKQWNGGLTGNQNPEQVTVSGPVSITVTFERIPIHMPIIRKN